MPTVRALSDLFRAIAAEDIGAATASAALICKAEERKGHRSAARQLRGALHHSRTSKSGLPPINGIQSTSGFFATGLMRLPETPGLQSVVLRPTVRTELAQVAKEWRYRSQLRDHRIAPRSKLLFHGPPGCGKSLTARALAADLSLPCFMVRFDAVIGAYLGQTATHLRQLFHFAETTPCILLLDEIDALGKRRGNPLDVGELDRIVISLMQELEHAQPQGVVIATSNLPSYLDDALWRRFDLDVQFPRPTRKELREFAQTFAESRQSKLPPKIVQAVLKAKSFAAAERSLIAHTRNQFLAKL